MTPTDVMDRPAWKFWMDARVRAAGVAWENAQQKAAMDDSGTTGAATGQEKEDLVDSQEERADRREATDGQPDLTDQLDAMGGED